MFSLNFNVLKFNLFTDRNDLTSVSFQLSKLGPDIQWWRLAENSRDDILNPASPFKKKNSLTIIAFSDRVAPAGLSFFTGYGSVNTRVGSPYDLLGDNEGLFITLSRAEGLA